MDGRKRTLLGLAIFVGVWIGTVKFGASIDVQGDPFVVLLVDEGAVVSCASLEHARARLTVSGARVRVSAREEPEINRALEAISYGLGQPEGTIYLGSVSIEDEPDGGAVVTLRCVETEHHDDSYRYRVRGNDITPLGHQIGANKLVILGSTALAAMVAFAIMALVPKGHSRAPQPPG